MGRVLIGCEFSGVVRDAFIAAGHNAWSCDLLPTERPGPHIQRDVLEVLDNPWGWDLMIAHPPCTHLCTRGAWHSRKRGKPEEIEEAFDFFMALYNAPIPAVCIENPIGIVSSRFRRPNQIVNPFDFGERQRKPTCLWLRGLPPLFYTGMVPHPEPISIDRTTGKKRYFTDCTTGSKRAFKRAVTFIGIARAMADQWGPLLRRESDTVAGSGSPLVDHRLVACHPR